MTPAERTALATLVVMLTLAPAATAASPPGVLEQLPGEAGCIVDETETAIAGCDNTGRALNAAVATAVSPDGRHVYVASQGESLTVFDRDPATGALAQKAGEAGCIMDAASGVPGCDTGRALDTPRDVVVSPDGENVYVSTFSSDAVAVFDREPASGTLTQKEGAAGCIVDQPHADITGCDNTGRGLNGGFGMALSPNGESLYLAAETSNAVAAFDRHTGTGALAQLPGAAGCVVDAPSVDIATCDNTGRALHEPVDVTARGTVAYVAANTSDAIATLERDSTDGSLTQLAGTAGCVVNEPSTDVTDCDNTGRALDGPFSVALSPSGTHAYAIASNSSAVATFDVASVSGAAAQKPGEAGCTVDEDAVGVTACFNAGRGIGVATGVAVSGDGLTLYVTANGDDGIAAFDRDPVSGVLGQKAGAAGCIVNGPAVRDGCTTGARAMTDPFAVALSSDDESLYAASNAQHAVAIFRRDLVPVCEPLSATAGHNQATAIPLRCTDPNGDPTSLAAGAPVQGELGPVDQPAARVVYTPPTGFAGGDSFTYTATANGATSDPATASLDVLPGAAPVCASRSQSVAPARATTLALTCAAGGDPFTYAIVSPPARGTLGGIDQAAGLVGYTPGGGRSGPDSFTYGATSAFGTSTPAPFALDVLDPQVDRLLVALFQGRLRAQAGDRVRLRYVSTLEADVTLTVRRKRRVITRRRATARVGANAIGLRTRTPGLYRLRLTATNGDQRVSRSASLRVTKRR
jgi:DNA-binding beta-propeller fold protein YncE